MRLGFTRRKNVTIERNLKNTPGARAEYVERARLWH
jgi:hypothetical protein